MKFRLYAYAVMPDHVHLLILPRGKFDISDINHRIKGNFAIQYMRNHKGSVTGERVSPPYPVSEPSWFAYRSNKRHRIRINPVWQKSFYDRIIRSNEQLSNTIQYINCNAVKHQLVDDPIKWPYSSFHNYNGNKKALIEIDSLVS